MVLLQHATLEIFPACLGRGLLNSLWEGYFNFLLHQDFVSGEHQNAKDTHVSLSALGKHGENLTSQKGNILDFA